MSITKDIWSPLLGSKIVSRTSKELTRSLLGVRTLMNPLLLRRGFPVVLLALALGLFALSPTIRAVDPPPDGGYPNSNTAEGDNALFNLTTGFNNTALVFARCLTTQAADSTRPAVIRRSLATQPATPIQPPVLLRSYSTQSASKTQPPVLMRCLTTHAASKTRPPALLRS
jgi:hypothetical protein